MVSSAQLRYEIEADTSWLDALRSSIASAATCSRVPNAIRDRMIIALDEAVSNVIRHGLTNGDRAHGIGIGVRIEEGLFEVIIYDHGTPYDPKGKQCHDIRDKVRSGTRSGIGLYLINKIADEILYQQGSHGTNELILRTRY